MSDAAFDNRLRPEATAAPRRLTTRLATAAWIVVILLLAWYVYRPGLTGGFLFDDFANLPALGAYGPVDNMTTFWRYVTSGSADPTGRPLALLSFLIDARNWPADPYPFKRTGVLLHLLNGLLLYALLARLGGHVTAEAKQRQRAAALGMALWLLHPLFVSTTLYIVQREAMLPATFVLLGLIGYVAGYERARRGRADGAWLAGISLVACTAFGILSKANGALLPLFAWVIDAILLRDPAGNRPARGFTWMRRGIVVAPSLLLGVYLIYETYAGFAKGVLPERPWTLAERLLTEPRVVVDYLSLLWIPRPYSTGLFNDGIVVSSGWLTPPETLPCTVALAVLLAGAIAFRKRYPPWSAAILFYLAGQLLESTSIPLELYFEHRNYVPALLMFWPLALWLCADKSAASSTAATPAPSHGLWLVRRILAFALPLGLAALTFLRADLWGNADDQALLWGEKNTHSPRAQAYAAQVEAARGQTAAGIARLQHALLEHPDDIQLALNLVGLKCTARTLTADDIAHASTALRETRNVGRLGFEWFEEALPAVREQRCKALDLRAIETLLSAAASNPSVVATFGRRQDILNLQARLALAKNEPDRALALFNAALDADARPGAALQQATTLATAGFPQLALDHIDHLEQVWKPVTQPAPRMPAIHQWLLWREGYWQHEIAHLRGVLESDVKAQAAPQATPPAAH